MFNLINIGYRSKQLLKDIIKKIRIYKKNFRKIFFFSLFQEFFFFNKNIRFFYINFGIYIYNTNIII